MAVKLTRDNVEWARRKIMRLYDNLPKPKRVELLNDFNGIMQLLQSVDASLTPEIPASVPDAMKERA